jgi:outer membrane receptor protein involved in Fe transport
MKIIKNTNIPFKRTRYFAACAAVISTSSLPANVSAQGLLEEVIVTAQKRAENLQDVPISVQAFSGEKLADLDIKDVFDLQTSAPGLKVDSSQGSSTTFFTIRGIGTSSQNFGFESSVGLYVDGVYRARQGSMINQLVDMASVDVLRGPQGTLFGRNSLSGAVQFTTVKPDHDGSGFVEVTAGNYGLLNLSGAASFSAIEDVLAFRFTGFSSERDGYVENIGLPGSDDINDRDRYGFRAQALWTPTENLSILVIADDANVDETCCAPVAVIDSNRLDGRAARNSLGLSLLGQPGLDTYKEANGATYISEDDAYEDITALNQNPTSQSDDSGLSVQVNWYQDELTWTSITGYREFDSRDQFDSDFSNFDAVAFDTQAKQEAFSQELRVDYEGDTLRYVLGAYYYQQDLESESTLTFGPDINPVLGVLSGTTPIFGFSAGLPIATLNAIQGTSFDTSGFIPTGGTATDINEQEHKSWALFGQFDYDLTETLMLTAGLRYSDEEKELSASYSDSGGNFAGFARGGLFARTARRDDITPSSDGGSLDDSQVTGTIKLSWFLDDDIMLYGSYGTGYKAGGTNTDRIEPSLSQTFDAETAASYELGAKMEFPEQGIRLNVALYTTDIEDLQVATFDGSNFNVQNAATVDTYGLELDMLWEVTESLTVNVAYAKTIAEYGEYEEGNCQVTSAYRGVPDAGATISDPAADPQGFLANRCDRSGDRVPFVPEDTFTVGVRQDWRINDSMFAYAGFEYSYKGDVVGLASDPLADQDAYDLVNVRLGMTLEDYQTDIVFWGRNVFDQDYLTASTPTPLHNGHETAYSREPATFGLTVRKKF